VWFGELLSLDWGHCLKKLPVRNKAIQPLTMYAYTLNATMHSVTDGRTYGETDDIMMLIATAALLYCTLNFIIGTKIERHVT